MGQNESMPRDETIGNGGSGPGPGRGAEMEETRSERGPSSDQDGRATVHRAVGPRRDEVRKSPPLPPAPPRREQQQRSAPKIVQPIEFRSPDPSDPEEEDAIKTALKSIAPSFSVIHQRLLGLAIDECKTNENLAIAIPPTGPLSSHHLRSMMAMVEMEFLASLKKELIYPEEKNVSDPLPFDIFLMEPSLFRPGADLRQQLALCVPTKKKKGERTKKMMWYDGRGSSWDLAPQCHRRKVASLSGTARILEALMHPPTPLMRAAMTREMIVDSNDVLTTADTLYTAGLNDSQQDAVSTVSSPDFTEGMFCVLGPPGTGKTHAINAMIEAVREGIIVTAPSNAAVANVALKVYASSYFDIDETVVFGQNCDESVRFLNPLHRSEEFFKFMKSYNKLEDVDAQDCKRKEFALWLRLDPSQDTTISDLAQLCPFIDLEESSGRKLHSAKLHSASVIFCTLNSSGSNMLRNAVHGAFSTYILDEAGQCPESEFYIATTFPGIDRMIVVGDPKQLPPTVIDQQCSKWGYGVSWLARTYNQDPQRVHLLNTQYRMDKAILNFPNKQFYNKQIMSGDNVVGREPYVSNPILFVDTEGRGREEKNQFSWKNEYEAVVIKSILNTDEDIVTLRSCSPHTRTIIISPYRAQVCLLTDQLKKVRGVEVTTVDSVQGSEADIVILSTVRAKHPGFVDDSQRLNVALTRAKRVLRVVGDLSFFLSLGHAGSTLKSLAKYYQHRRLSSAARVQSIAWTTPDWRRQTLWIPTMTSKFHDSIKDMTAHDKNVCFNTVLAISTPDLKRLMPRPSERDRPSWYVSSLRGYIHRLCVVWIPKLRGSDLVAEAHFAGTKHNCNTFIQQHVNVPFGTCIVLPDLSGVQKVDDLSEEKNKIKHLITSWPLTNSLQNAIMSCSIDSLPQGNLVLDPHQQEIAVSSPPLLIESRSGTGKTNVLFQHAVIHTQVEHQQSPGCFVTVSPRLCNELRQRYEEMRTIADGDVPDFLFFSRDDLLRGLLANARIDNVNMDDLCSFREYSKERALLSHARTVIEERLVENEIGGVILGSLTAGIKQRPLNREEYLEEKRSNITNKTEHGKARRAEVYNEFERYKSWKIQRKSGDINDVVLMLLKQNLVQIFDSAYIDEVQDFSYASLLLICTIGGAKNLKWIFAGDTAQMISPGCSFAFNGLKQTLLSLQAGIESKLSKVSHLLVNYRTTRDILLLGNSILSVAKINFPHQIAHSLPEIAMKDLGLKVRICDFDVAISMPVNFGHNQALIHSEDDSVSSCDNVPAIRQWLKDHPFILSSLDSKGLEFDDVVVAFEFGRKVWDATSQSEESLRMLRELYVAVTRAKRRVVILIKRKDKAMRSFLDNLGCDIETIKESKQIQVEFDCETSAETWHQKGVDLFDEGHFGLAASCFAAANDWGLSNWAKGKHLKSLGDRSEAANSYRRAARYFFEALDYQRTLDVFQELSYCPPWDERDNSLFERAQSEVPTHFDRHETVRLSLVADRWQIIELRDLKDPETSTLFAGHKDHPKLTNMIKKCTEEDRSEISKVLPSIVAQYHISVKNYSSAVELYIHGKETKLAIESTKQSVESARLSDVHIRGSITAWSKNTRSLRNLNEESYVPLLINMYKSPMEVAKSAGKKCLQTFGRRVVIFAVEYANLEMMNLYEFHPTEFRTEVNTNLESKFRRCIDIVKWYMDKNDYENANQYAQRHWKKIENPELLNIISLDHKIRPGNLMSELKRRKLALDAICRTFLPQMSYEDAIKAAELELALPAKRGDSDASKLREIVKANFEYLKNNGVFSQLHESTLSNFLDLCRDPEFGLTILKTNCAKFGKDRIMKAVSYGGPFSNDPMLLLSNFSGKYFKRTSSYDLLKAFHNVGNNEMASWYVELNRENWTNKELLDAFEIMGLPFPIGVELLRRGMAAQALPHALDSGDEKTAIEASTEMLKSPCAAEKNIVKVISAWGEGRLGMFQSPQELLKFTKNPNHESCDKMTTLLINFGPSVTIFLKNHVSRGNCDESMLNSITRHHLELREHIKKYFYDDEIGSASKTSTQSPTMANIGEKSQDKEHSNNSLLHSASASDQMADSAAALQVGDAQTGKKNKRKNRKKKKNR